MASGRALHQMLQVRGTWTQANEVCGPFQPPVGWSGHPTHELWRRGAALHCTQCEAKATRRDGESVATKRLQERCEKGEQNLEELLCCGMHMKRPRVPSRARSQRGVQWIHGKEPRKNIAVIAPVYPKVSQSFSKISLQRR